MDAFDPAPTRLEDVVTPAWLTTMLRIRWPNASVHNVEVAEMLATQATKVRLALTLDGGGPDVPTRICIKGVLTDTGAVASASIVETLFYQNAAASLPVRVPDCVYASLNAAGNNGVVVMHDMIAAGGKFCTALVPFTPEDAIDGLEQLAALHVAGWQGTAMYDTPWIPRFLDQISVKPIIPREMLQGLLDGPRGAELPAGIRDAGLLQRGLEHLAAQIREVPNCLIHGDAHAGNVYRNAQGQLGIVDWQILQKGDWAQDVGYHLAAVLTPEDRRIHERRLLDDYLDQVKALGGPDINRETAWTRYRAGMVYGYYLWAITRKVDPAITNEFVRRIGLAVSDLESFAAAGV